MTTLTTTAKRQPITRHGLALSRRFAHLADLVRPRRSRVIAMQCAGCHRWHKPRQLRLPNLLCRACQDTAYRAARARLHALVAATRTGGSR